MTSMPSHLTPTRLRPSAPATTPSVPTHAKRDTAPRRKVKSARTRQTRLDNAVKSPKQRKRISQPAIPNVPQTPTRPSGYKAPTNAPARIVRRYDFSPIRSPIRGSLADEDDQLPEAAPLDLFSRPDWSSLFAGEC